MPIAWKAGDKIEGRWQVWRVLQGGLGVVYIVYDCETGEPLAAKTFRDDVFAQDPSIAARFNQEALTWVSLDLHENIACAKYVESIEGKPYVFSEYVSGGDLGGWIRTPRLTEDVSQILRFSLQFCDGMAYATSKGLKAHRDIKPQNCLVTEDGTLKITDFGLATVVADLFGDLAEEGVGGVAQGRTVGRKGFWARLLGMESKASENAAAPPKEAAMVAGTLAYMAPEQFEHPQAVDARSDIYSLGIMFFEMMMGFRPFEGRDQRDYYRMHKHEDYGLTLQDPDLDSILRKCLAKRPEDRFQQFAELRASIAAKYKQLTGEAVPAPKTGVALTVADWVNKGYSLRALGRNAEALKCVDRALADDPSNAIALNNRAAALLALGRTEEAIDYADRTISGNPRDAKAWSNKGVALNRKGQHEEALKCHEVALRYGPRSEKYWLNKGAVLADLERHSEAIACFEQAIRLNPLYANAWFSKGQVLRLIQRPTEAIECLDKALEINPQLDLAWWYKGVVLDSLKRFRDAVVCYDHILALKPDDEQALFNKGADLAAIGSDDEALTCFDRVLDLNPKNSNAWFNKAVSLLNHRNDRKGAIKCFGEAVALGHALAQKALKECQQNSGKDAEALFAQADRLHEAGKLAEAIQCYSRACAIDPTRAEAWTNMGVALTQSSNPEEAIKCFDKALAIDRNCTGAMINKGAVLGEMGSHAPALELFEQALRLGDRRAERAIQIARRALQPVVGSAERAKASEWNKQGLALMEAKDAEGAMRCFDRAIELWPENATFWFNKAAAYFPSGQYGEAIKCCERAISIDPKFIQARVNMAFAMGLCGRLEEALACYEELVRMGYPQAVSGAERCRKLLANRKERKPGNREG